MMIIRVLPIHVPPCYEGGYLKPLHWNHNMTYDDHLVWPIHVPRRCEPLITPHLSLWGNARTRATFPTHKKSHNPHPQGGGGEGGQDGYITLGGGWGGGLAKPGSYILYTYVLCTHKMYINTLHDGIAQAASQWKSEAFEVGNCWSFVGSHVEFGIAEYNRCVVNTCDNFVGCREGKFESAAGCGCILLWLYFKMGLDMKKISFVRCFLILG